MRVGSGPPGPAIPDWQFGRGVAVVTVPWPAVTDLIAPAFRPIAD